jgi:FkbM family methyltransferase
VRESLGAQYRALRDRRRAGTPVDFDALLRRFYEGFLKPGDTAIDVGAFKGKHTLAIAAAIAGPGAALHALEANPEMAALLRARIAADPALSCVMLHECAAAAENGIAAFVVAVETPGYSGLRQRDYDQPDVTTRRIGVHTVRLDWLLPNLPGLAYIKLDIEGGEFDALRGAEGLLAKHRPAISFEFGSRAYGAYGVDPGAVFDWFEARRYALFDIIGNPLPARDRFLRADAIPGVFDFLAVPAEDRALRRLAEAQQAALAAMLTTSA